MAQGKRPAIGTNCTNSAEIRKHKKGSKPRTEGDRDTLQAYSPTDKPWDTHKDECTDVGGIYAGSEFTRYAERMEECARTLRFGWENDRESGESKLRLREAQFCRVRLCPVCQWRRSLMWQARFYQALPTLAKEYPAARWIFLTLTVRNCDITELGGTLTAMNLAWQRLIKRKEFRPVLGWVRTTEVTRGKDGTAHPHFHALLMVPYSMVAGKNYVKQGRWTELWMETARLDYLPQVDVRAVRPKKGATAEDGADMLRNAVAETLKYSTKPADLLADDQWLLELTRQTHKRRFVATGGALKNVLKVEEPEADAELVGLTETEADDDGSRLAFQFRESARQYRRFPQGDSEAGTPSRFPKTRQKASDPPPS